MNYVFIGTYEELRRQVDADNMGIDEAREGEDWTAMSRADDISEESRAWGEERMRQYRELMRRLGLRQPEPILPDLPRG